MDCGSRVTGDASNAHANAHCGVKAGDAQTNARAGVFAAGNTAGGPVTTGAYGELNANGHGLSLQHARTPGQFNATTASAQANLFKNDQHSVQANAFHSHIKPNQGPSFDKFGGGLNMQSASGHGAGLGVTHVPQFNMTTMCATGQANLWTTPNRAGSLDATVNASRHMNGPFKGQHDFGGGLTYRHRF